MSKFYSINIQSNFVNYLLVEKKKSQYRILELDVIDIEDFPQFLKNKKNFYISIDSDEAIDDVITLPSSIKKDSVIRSLILKKFKNSLSTKQILLNYKKISQDIDNKTITYKIDAIPEIEYVKKLDYIENWLEIKSSTINKFALLSLTRECFSTQGGYGYFSIHTQGKHIIVLAIDHNKNLLFDRSSSAMSDSPQTLQLAMVEEINQTIAYVKQQFRSVQFSNILLSGSMTLDDIIADNLFLSTNLPISILYPNTFIKGFEQEEPQHHIMSIGGFLVKKEEQFLPHKIFNLREYNITIIMLMIFSFLTLISTSYLAYQQYEAYTEDLENYENIKNRLIRLVRKTDTYSQEELEKSFKHLQIAEEFLQHSPSDYLITLKPLIEILQPKSYSFQDKKALSPSISLVFEKKFQSLSKLYNFEKLFLKTFTTANEENTLEYKNNTNYQSLKFHATITNKVKKAPIINQRRRRRR